MMHHTLGHLSPIDSPVVSPGHAERMRQYQHTGEPTATHKASNPKDVIGSGKAPLSLVPASLRAGAAMAFMEGALKYGRFNWRLAGVRASIYYDALNRHMDAWFNGEDTDPGSGLPHLYKAAACIAILIDATEIDKLVDDRAPYADMDGIYEELAGEVIRMKTAHEMGPEIPNPHQCVLADSPKPFHLPVETPLKSRQRLNKSPAEVEWTTPCPMPGGRVNASEQEKPTLEDMKHMLDAHFPSQIQRGSEKFDPETYIKAGGSMR